MKFRKFGRISLALAVSLGTGLGVTSCSTDHTVGYMYVTGSQYNQISGFRIDSNLGNLTPTQNSPYGSGGVNPIKALVANCGTFLYVLNAGCGGTGQAACPCWYTAGRYRSKYLALHRRRTRRPELPDNLYQPGQLSDLDPDRRFRHSSVRAGFPGARSHHLHGLCEWESGHHLWRHHILQHRPQYRPALADHQPAGEEPDDWRQPHLLSRGQLTHQLYCGSE